MDPAPEINGDAGEWGDIYHNVAGTFYNFTIFVETEPICQ